VQPETILKWHRSAYRLFWRHRSKSRNHPRLSADTIALVRERAKRDRLWGAERIRGELLKLGIRIDGVPSSRIPVHPVLARLLAEWKLSGWERTYGRAPTPNDLIVPTRNMTVRPAADAQRAFLQDLETLGLRRRRGQDLLGRSLLCGRLMPREPTC
jgi:hypothetical protein